MKLSAKAIYGVRALLDLSLHGQGRASQVRDVAERQSIPPRFLEQILQDLKRAGMVTAKRGPKGGFQLAADPEGLRLGDVLRAVDGGAEVLAHDPESATPPEDEVTRVVLAEAFDRVGREVAACFDGVTLAALRDRAEELRAASGVPRKYVYSI